MVHNQSGKYYFYYWYFFNTGLPVVRWYKNNLQSEKNRG